MCVFYEHTYTDTRTDECDFMCRVAHRLILPLKVKQNAIKLVEYEKKKIYVILNMWWTRTEKKQSMSNATIQSTRWDEPLVCFTFFFTTSKISPVSRNGNFMFVSVAMAISCWRLKRVHLFRFQEHKVNYAQHKLVNIDSGHIERRYIGIVVKTRVYCINWFYLIGNYTRLDCFVCLIFFFFWRKSPHHDCFPYSLKTVDIDNFYWNKRNLTKARVPCAMSTAPNWQNRKKVMYVDDCYKCYE